METPACNDAGCKESPKCEGFQCFGTNNEVFRCVSCDSMYCEVCWARQGPHQPGKAGPDGLPHEKTDEWIYQLLRPIFNPLEDDEELSKLHIEDEETTWFGVEKDSFGKPSFQDYGRYAALMAQTKQPKMILRFPQLISFVGQTGAGKSTIIKLLISLREHKAAFSEKSVFKSPVVGSVKNDNSPTSGDVHLFIDPLTAPKDKPLVYADCEGLEGGEVPPRASKFKETGQNQAQRWLQIFRSSPRELLYAAQNSEAQNREWAVHKLYPRLLYTFSDVVVFVLQNPRVFESKALRLLLEWASTSLESSLNQPSLPHAIVVLNSTDASVDRDEWDTFAATEKLMDRVKHAVLDTPYFKNLAAEWQKKGRTINTTIDLIHCYYADINVVRIPKKGRYKLTYEQVNKLQSHIQESCNEARRKKSDAHMLSNSDQLNVYLQAAFDHFATKENLPFNFVQVALKNNPVPQNFEDQILGFAVKVQEVTKMKTVPRLFMRLSGIVAASIWMDCARRKYPSEPADLFDSNYASPCTAGLKQFCDRFWPCSFMWKNKACAAVKNCHSVKGHQDANGKVFFAGDYIANFDLDKFETTWKQMIKHNLEKLNQEWIKEKAHDPSQSDEVAAYEVHQRSIESFWASFVPHSAQSFDDPTRCLSCLVEEPQHPLPCGHVLCTPCLKAYGDHDDGKSIQINFCPLHKGANHDQRPWVIHLKPDYAGVRILTLDGGGIRGIVELEVLRAIQKSLGGQLRLENLFDLIVGTSTGGIIALGLGCTEWSLDSCISKFKELCDEAFTRRNFGAVPYLKHASRLKHGSQYKTKPLRNALKTAFGTDQLYGGTRKDQAVYSTKTAVTATSGTGERGLVLANYSRQEEGELGYKFEFPNNLAIWEAASATSAAPLYFKPFEAQGNLRRMYLDGAIYYNNPVRVANHERKLLWPDVADHYPDILLSIGTGKNGALIEKQLKAEKHTDSNSLNMQLNLSNNSSKSTKYYEKVKEKMGKPFTHLHKGYELLLNRFDVILDAEREWKLFCADTVNEKHDFYHESRYHRLNVDLGKDPPPLDDKSSLSSLQEETAKILKNADYQSMIEKIAHQLVASTFYFVKGEIKPDGLKSFICTGKIMCRLEDTSVRSLGECLKTQQREKYQPFFSVRRDANEPFLDDIEITRDTIRDMIECGHFSMEKPVEIKLPTKTTPTMIFINLCGANRQDPELYPLSGFPRCLVTEDEENVTRNKKREQCRKLRVVDVESMRTFKDATQPTTAGHIKKISSYEVINEQHDGSDAVNNRRSTDNVPTKELENRKAERVARASQIRRKSLSELRCSEAEDSNDVVPPINAENLSQKDMAAL